MNTILVVEDEDGIRTNITRLLGLEGYKVWSAVNGREGLELARAQRPDVILSDLNMPEMNGFELLAAVRDDPLLAATPFMLLTAMDDRATMRRGMSSGADDYLPKPFRREELLDAVQSLLRKKARVDRAIKAALADHEVLLRRSFSESIEGNEGAGQFASELPIDIATEELVHGAVLVATIRNFTALAEKLTAEEITATLDEYFERACVHAVRQGGQHLKLMGGGLRAVFLADAGAPPGCAQRRALAAAVSIATPTGEFQTWLDAHFADRSLPPFEVGAGACFGELSLCKLDASAAGETIVLGDTAALAARLEAAGVALGWRVVASAAMVAQAGAEVASGRIGVLALDIGAGTVNTEVVEVLRMLGSSAAPAVDACGVSAAQQQRKVAVADNAQATARALKAALDAKLGAVKDHAFAPGSAPLRLRGYRITRHIGAGGMTQVYLAERESDGLPVVFKVLEAHGQGDSEHLARFIQEHALLSKIDHPYVVKIHGHGFTDDHAYIAMEYFDRGDLRAELKSGLSQQRALTVARQVALALGAIHDRGVIHRDLKPDNLMVRANGAVALADFGIAKFVTESKNQNLTMTMHGDLVGTPYYMSPEQAAGRQVTCQSDLYSFGVMLYEMLTGHRPYRADSLEALLACHMNAPTPALPPECAFWQPILNRLMAKDLAQRYPSATALLADLGRLG